MDDKQGKAKAPKDPDKAEFDRLYKDFRVINLANFDASATPPPAEAKKK